MTLLQHGFLRVAAVTPVLRVADPAFNANEMLKALTCLRWLLLDDIGADILLPVRAIASLPLNVFSHYRSILYYLTSVLDKEEDMIEELRRLQNLIDISITVNTSFSMQKIFQIPNF